MSKREMLLEAIEKTEDDIASSQDLLGVAGVMDRAELHNILYSLQKSGKIEFRERHNGGQLRLTRIRLLRKKEAMQTVPPPVAEEAVETQDVVDDVPSDEAPPENGTKTKHTNTILEWLSKQDADSKGWVMMTPGEIAGHLGIEAGLASATLGYLEKRNEVELVRIDAGKQKRIIGLRPISAAHAERDEKVKTFVNSIWSTMPDTPLLDEYLKAKTTASSSPWLSFKPEPIYEEALSLRTHLEHMIND